ncbi:solute carrier family 12 member 3 [Coniochaeta ligniaria NRRL 30616]|uniref:Solute carrier family 12 member 3 n=1 Tax=Coniochaeta ligniaria NRRL 30616 TaxID=1408157 RepID=A0A1J7JJ06_9PEZI|nr:solute carrier family 12 member 3 [Coniochaeta ligniaria NRRL 30616]
MTVAYLIDFVTTLSLSAIASNGEVKGGGAYYLISRSLGPEFGGSIGILFYLAQVLNTALNVVGLIDCLKLNFGSGMPHSFWWEYLFETVALAVCAALCLAGSGIFAKASNGLLVILVISIASIPFSALFVAPFQDVVKGIHFTGLSLDTLRSNLWPHRQGMEFKGAETFRELFGILFPATSGIFAGASMSGDLKSPSRDIPMGTLWALLSTFIAYLIVILSLGASTAHSTFLHDTNVIQDINVWAPIIFAGECATTFFSALMGLIGSAKLLQALARDRLLPGLWALGRGTKRADEPVLAIFLTYAVAQIALFANLNQIATFISMGYQMTFFVMNLACFLLKIGSAPNFRPGFKFFTWQSAFVGSILSAAAMFFIDETYASTAVCLLVFLFLLIHYLSPPKHWGDVSQNLIYHQVRKYLLRLKPEHIKFWRPQIILLVNDPRKHIRLVQFCNSMKKGGLYILGHVIVTDDFSAGVQEAKIQQAAWTHYISEFSRIKAFVQLTMSPSITWGVRNLMLSSGLGGLRPNVAVLGFYNLNELRESQPLVDIPEVPMSPTPTQNQVSKSEGKATGRARGDTTARLVEGFLPTDVIRKEGMMNVTSYMTILEDLALRFRINVAVGKGFDSLQSPRRAEDNSKRYIDLWPIQMSAEVEAEGKNVLTSNFDTYTLILQLGFILHSVPTWKKAYRLRVLVFVEYENEVEEEQGRVKALLDKLRIEADIVVFWLACGDLATYEMIIHGRSDTPDTEVTVNDCLQDDTWWQEIQSMRGRSRNATASQELASIANVLESTSARSDSDHLNSTAPQATERRRASVALLSDLPKKSTVSQLTRLGINMGIRTQNLPNNVFDDSDTEGLGDADSESDSSGSSLGDFNDAASDGISSDVESNGRSSIPVGTRRKSHGDLSDRPQGPGKVETEREAKMADKTRRQLYGTTLSEPRDPEWRIASGPSGAGLQPKSTAASPEREARNTARPGLRPLAHTGAAPDESPSQSRQHSRHGSSAIRFSSNLTPKTTITDEDGSEPRIMFAQSESGNNSRNERPNLLRHASSNRMADKQMPERSKSGQGQPRRSVSFAEPESNSQGESAPGNIGDGDAQLNISELLAAYAIDTSNHSESGSSYSTQGLALSFNDLPSRAQHLILNELMRQNSHETAVLFTTLPIPEEGTCQSEDASMKYLSDMEVLCNELPPILLVLSNNMTVTVSL